MQDIYTRLANGESADAIAQEFTNALNEAESRFQKEQEEARVKAEAEAKAKEARNANRKAAKAAGRILVRDFGTWIMRYYPSFGLTEDDLDDESIDALVELIMMTLDLEGMRFHITGSKPSLTMKASDIKSVESDPFADFFKSFGL